MRTDYVLYAVALICFVVAIYAAVSVEELYVYTLAVVGIVFVGLGYMARPKPIPVSTVSSPPPPPASTPQEKTPEPLKTAEAKEEPKPEPARRASRKTRRRKRTA